VGFLALHALFQHPFITYILVLSTVMALFLYLFLKLLPRGRQVDPFILYLPLAIPVLSYAINYLFLGKSCGFEHTYGTGLPDLASLHLFCLLNEPILYWMGPLSLLWLSFSLTIYGLRWYRIRKFIKTLPVYFSGGEKPRKVLLQLCRDTGIPCPGLRLVNSSRPVILTTGLLTKTILLSTGALELLDEQELRAVLAHELAHIQRAGYYLNWLFVLLRDLTMFSPASIWAYNLFRHEEEKTCDALAVAQTGLSFELASALVKFMKYGNKHNLADSLVCLLPAGNSPISRVRQLIKKDTTAVKLGANVNVVVTILFLTLLAFIC
jgi:Zn-dependent protease with chaperone function